VVLWEGRDGQCVCVASWPEVEVTRRGAASLNKFFSESGGGGGRSRHTLQKKACDTDSSRSIRSIHIPDASLAFCFTPTRKTGCRRAASINRSGCGLGEPKSCALTDDGERHVDRHTIILMIALPSLLLRRRVAIAARPLHHHHRTLLRRLASTSSCTNQSPSSTPRPLSSFATAATAAMSPNTSTTTEESSSSSSSSYPFPLHRLTGALGAEIRGVSLKASELGPQERAGIRRAFLEHSVLVFRDQHGLGPDDLLHVAEVFGPVEARPVVKAQYGLPTVHDLVREPGTLGRYGEVWHADCSYMRAPPLGALLYAVEVPVFGNDTIFANMTLALEALSPGLRRVLEPLRAVHSAFKMVDRDPEVCVWGKGKKEGGGVLSVLLWGGLAG
jgi:hypothetical protein